MIEAPEPGIQVSIVVDAAFLDALKGLDQATLDLNPVLKAVVGMIRRAMARHEARIPETPAPREA